MILKQLVQIGQVGKKIDKAYLLDEIANQGDFYPKLLNIIFDKDVRFFAVVDKINSGLSDIGLLSFKSNQELDEELFSLLNILSSEELRGNAANQKCIDFANQLNGSDEVEMFLNILDNKLRLGINATDVNKYCKKLNIKQFEVMFAKRLDKVKNIKFNNSYVIQPKIDGMRCIGIKYPNQGIKFYTRTGKDITSLQILEKQVNDAFWDSCFVMDGEVESGACLEEVGAIRRKTEQVEDSILTLFGSYKLTQWLSKNHTETYESVYERTCMLINNTPSLINFRVIPSFKITPSNEDQFYTLIDGYYQQFLEQKYEGAVLKTIDHIYSPSVGTKRSDDWIKIKPQESTEGKIVDILEGEASHQGMVGKFMVKWLDKTFEIAPGKLSHEKRQQIWNNKQDYIGLNLEFTYQLLSKYGIPRHAGAVKIRGI